MSAMITVLVSALGCGILVCLVVLGAVFVVAVVGSSLGSTRLGLLRGNIGDIPPSAWTYVASLAIAGVALLLTAGGLPWEVLGR